MAKKYHQEDFYYVVLVLCGTCGLDMLLYLYQKQNKRGVIMGKKQRLTKDR